MAVSITQAEVELLAPELTGKLSAGQWTLVLEIATSQTGDGWSSDRRASIAGAYLAAHLATFMKPGGADGSPALQSVSVGDVSKTYAVSVAQDASSLQGTTYGKEYVRLCGLWCARMGVT